MRSIFFLLFSTCIGLISNAQQKDPVHFNYTTQKIADKQYELRISATMDQGWHLYSQTQLRDAIAQPTKITFSKNPFLTIIGSPKEIGRKEQHELKELGITNIQYQGKVDFVQSVTLKAKVRTYLSGSITYQVCTEESCLPAKTVAFKIPIGNQL